MERRVVAAKEQAAEVPEVTGRAAAREVVAAVRAAGGLVEMAEAKSELEDSAADGAAVGWMAAAKHSIRGSRGSW